MKSTSPSARRPGIHPVTGAPAIHSIHVRHPWRTVAAIVILLALALFVIDASGRSAYDWAAFAEYLFDPRIIQAAGVTLVLTIASMIIAILLGVLLAVMRQSPNPIFTAASGVFIWLFRGTPVYVQLVFWGLLSTIYKTIEVGLPFQDPWLVIESIDAVDVFWIAVFGLALNEAAYMAEIVRAGLLSVDTGQLEASTALGLTWAQTMRKIVIPQAMRIIIPPTGNEVISMLKTTSLVTAVPFSLDLYTRSRDISAETLNPIPLLLVASVWYLAFTSLLMIGQYFLERRFARGFDQRSAPVTNTRVAMLDHDAELLPTGTISTGKEKNNE
ncbi:amino acid ABC transporter permease [Glaciibacter psychrotolerans]|uniref:Polar amino acid transport system permease protein n=1 Tax=Glaciibacter psychrotolerans TaxID=670054 RepID=A0A7Z0EBW0_9MICO|nr:amino acid ABC transporter permease [Leifsonia psychrotolerans]NYJ18673.1 polar amino acid transport system permease protein [Leifsonia psychrotolerans]